MSFIYPRVIAISRPRKTTEGQLGDVGYNALRSPSVQAPADDTPILSGLPASIQEDRQGQRNQAGLPSDAPYQPIYKVFIPASAAPRGSIQTSDIVTDDLGVRYVVFVPYWNSLGYRLGVRVLEV